MKNTFIILALFLLCCSTASYSQYIPPNIDFETGTTANWALYNGMFYGGPVTFTPTAPLPGRHEITSGTATDPYGGFPVVAPGGGIYSLKMGNNVTGYLSEKSRYYVHIPSGTSDYSLIYRFAVVLEDPGHPASVQPYMAVTAFDSATGLLVPCDSFVYISQPGLPGFALSTLAGPVYYKPWTSGNLRFPYLSGHTVAVDFEVADCGYGGHFGYGYIDMTGGLYANSITLCTAGPTVSLSGPNGYSSYRWTDSGTYLTTYGTAQNIVITTPTVTTTYALILTPYTGYGCTDTIYSHVNILSTCTGTPPPGIALAYRSAICGQPDTLTLSGYSTICGLAYQWQSSTDNVTWTNMTGAISSTYPYYNPYTSLYYRCAVKCIASGLTTYSSSVYVPAVSGTGMHTVINPPDTVCNGAEFYVSTCGASSSFNVTSWYGDGTSDNTLLSATGVRHATLVHHYAFPGSYTVKQVLYDGALAVDSVSFSYNYLYCSTLPVGFYFDYNHNCVNDSGDFSLVSPVKTEVDSSGIPIDTISATSGFYYQALGSPGTVYTFRVLPNPTMIVSCPSSGIFNDTIIPLVNYYGTKYVGFSCSSSSFDLKVNGTTRLGPHADRTYLTVQNGACNPVSAILTVTASKYLYSIAFPPASSVSGNTMTWNLGIVTNSPTDIKNIEINMEKPGSVPDYSPGDTSISSFIVTPTTGDLDTANNIEIRNDTVKSGFDPNFIDVTPQGIISPGTQLQYTIHFENTGNDTAFNIHIMDTLSPYVDAKSLTMVAASSQMNLASFNIGGQHIVKFDFPGINLLDSSHHGKCDGMVVFNINTRPGLPFGTVIPNHAGIYFDDNPVVMTDTVNNIIGTPPTTKAGPVNGRNSIEVFPNPAGEELTIKMDKDAYGIFTITNTIGQQMMQQTLSAAQTKVSVKELPAGLYYITFRGENGSKVEKFVKM